MHLHRRELLAAGGMLAGAAMTGLARATIQEAGDLKAGPLPPPIGRDERLARLARARALMQANDIGAIVVESGPSLD
jgi:Xaa-Pro dipeptidase